MKRFFACFVVLIPSLLLAESPTQRLLYLSEDAPIFLRLHVEVDGKSYESPWREFVDQLFDDMDEDDDGSLNSDESTRIPTRSQLARTGLSVRNSAARPTGDVSKEQFANYINKITGGPFSVSMSQQGNGSRARYTMMQNRTDVDVFQYLDANEDEKLSAQELAMSNDLLKMDIDDDELISADELLPAFSPYAQLRPSSQTNSTNTSPFVHLDPNQSPTRIVRHLIERYDRKAKDNKISREEIGMNAKLFAKLDIDASGRLDFDEIQQFIRNSSAQVEVTVRLGKRDEDQSAVEVTNSDKDLPFDGKINVTTDGQVTLIVGKVQIEIGSTAAGQSLSTEESYRRLLQQLDQDNNAYLDKSEVERSPFRSNFDYIDRDGDGKIFEKELLAFARQVDAGQRARTSLSISDQGNKLFKILDLNRDNRLNARELKAARSKITVWDEDNDDQISKTEIPQHWRLSVSRGTGVGFVAVNVAPVSIGQQFPQPANGPLWFRKMDTNRDGDVSQREFLGTQTDFERFDKNDDQLIDAAEATQKSERTLE